MTIFNINEERFYAEYLTWVQAVGNKYIEWYIDNTKTIHMFVMTNYGVGYHFSCKVDEVPENLKMVLKRQGQIYEVYS